MTDTAPKIDIVVLPKAVLNNMLADLKRLGAIEQATRNFVWTISDLGKRPFGSERPPVPEISFTPNTHLSMFFASPFAQDMFYSALQEVTEAIHPARI